MKRYIIGIFIAIIGLVYIDAALAVPTLGVATYTGNYAYNGDTPPEDDYIEYFCDNLYGAWDGNEGFMLDRSGEETLTVFSKLDPYQNDIWIVASWARGDTGFKFGDFDLLYDEDQIIVSTQINGYRNRPYSLLPLLDTPNYQWQSAPNDFPANNYWFYTAPMTYTGYMPGDYFFACANIVNGRARYHSPKTSSAGGVVPEPASMILLGSGLLGLAALKRKKKKVV